MKNSLAILFAALILLWAASFIDFEKRVADAPCPFCNESILSKQRVFEGEKCFALLNYKPAVDGHIMIIPKRHVERFEELTAEEAVEIHAMIARVDQAERQAFGATGYTLLQKNGLEAGQSVPHVHIHYYPRKASDSNGWLAFKIFAAANFKPLSDEELETLRSRLQG